MILWQSTPIYLDHELYSGTWQKTSLSIPRCYLPTSSSVCFFIFLPALCLVECFLLGLMILSHHFSFHNQIFICFTNSISKTWVWEHSLNSCIVLCIIKQVFFNIMFLMNFYWFQFHWYQFFMYILIWLILFVFKYFFSLNCLFSLISSYLLACV